MKSRHLACFVLAAAMFSPIFAQAQVPPLINYQGRLLDGTNLYNGSVNIKLSVYNSETEAFMLLCEDTGQVSVVDGLYSTYLGDGLASGDMSWLSQSGSKWIEVVMNTVTMRPRERLVSVPYAMMSGGVTNGAITSMMIGNNTIMGSHVYDGTIEFADIGQNSATNGQLMKWNGSGWVTANDLTSGGGALASYSESGTFSPSPQASGLDSIAQGRGAHAEGDLSTVGGGGYNRVGYTANNTTIAGGFSNAIGDLAYNSAIGGGFGNTIGNSSWKSTIAGGSRNAIGDSDGSAVGGGENNAIGTLADNASIGGGKDNAIQGSSAGASVGGGLGNTIDAESTNAVIGGGRYNRIGSQARGSVIAGGYSNVLADSATHATIGGGYENEMGNADYSAIVGGAVNRLEDGVQYSAVGGGAGNRIRANASYAVIAGGQANEVGTNADWAVVPGGYENAAGAKYSFAAGFRAKAMHTNTFVWSDGSEGENFISSNANTFIVRALGGVGIGKPDPRGSLDVAGRTYSRGITIEDEAFITVTTTSNDLQNGLNLLAAYNTASNMLPNGLPLGASNRVAVLVPPGRYNMDTGTLVMAAEYVDLVGLSSARDEQFVFGDGEIDGVLRQTANDVRIENLFIACIRTASGSRNAYSANSDLSNTVVRNCRFTGEGGSGRSMNWSGVYAGTYEDCAAGGNSFGSGSAGVAAGVFIRCDAGDNSFGGYQGEAKGSFVECTGSNGCFGGFGGVATGLFVRCRGGTFSFGGGPNGRACGQFEYCTGTTGSFGGNGGEASGVFIGCDGGWHSFGSGSPGSGSASGYFVDCRGGQSSFGSHYGSDASGTFINCVGGALSFACDGFCSGLFINCAGGDSSFGGNQDGILSGNLYNCVMAGSVWQGAGVPSKITGRMENCSWGADVTIQAGARIYNSTFLGNIDGDGSGNCRIAHVRCQELNLNALANSIDTPYNVIDSDLE